MKSKSLENKTLLSKDMTNGSAFGLIMRFTLPLLAGNILQQLYNIVDTIVVGKYLGDTALAAVGATGSITYFFYTLCLGLATGAGVIISQYFGAEQKDQVKQAVFNSAVLTGIFGVVVSVLGVLLTNPLLRILNTPYQLLPLSCSYMHITVGGTIIVAAYNWITSVMRSLGDSKTPLIFLGLANILNLFLDLLFVIVFKTGVTGAAWATVLTQGIAAIGSIIYAFCKNSDIRFSRQEIHIDKGCLLKCFRTGTPIAIQNGMVSVSMIVLQRVTNGFGQTVMAAYTVGMRIEQFAQQPFSSLNIAIATFTGQNTGAGKKERVKSGLHLGLFISSSFALLLMTLFLIFGKLLVSCFVNDESVIAIASFGIKLTSCFYVSLGIIHVVRGFLNGAGDTGYAMINGLTEIVMRIGVSVWLTQIPSIGYRGIWYTTCATWFATAAISVIRYIQGAWQHKSLITLQ